MELTADVERSQAPDTPLVDPKDSDYVRLQHRVQKCLPEFRIKELKRVMNRNVTTKSVQYLSWVYV